MVCRVELTKGAKNDLARHHRWLRNTAGLNAADAFLDDILAALETLAEFPLKGPIPPELEAIGGAFGAGSVRQISRPPYRLFYVVSEKTEQTATIILFADGRRTFRQLLQERLLSWTDGD